MNTITNIKTPFGSRVGALVPFLLGLVLAVPALAQPPAPTPQESSSGVEYLHVDALGSVRVVTDAQGAIVSRHDYLPFGEEVPVASRQGVGGYAGDLTPASPQRFTGKERDGETSLDYFGARYYSAAQGRFTSADLPFADQTPRDPQRWNLFAYARNNPLRFVDPTGRCSAPAGIGKGQIGICVGQFISARYIAGPFPPLAGHGDNRGPRPNGGTSRAQTTFVFDTGTRSIKSSKTVPGVSSGGALLAPHVLASVSRTGTATEHFSAPETNNVGDTSVSLTTVAKNGFNKLLPFGDIDMSATFTFGKDGSVGVEVERDGYPSLEIYSYDSEGNATLILFVQERKVEDLAPPMEQRVNSRRAPAR